MSGKEYTGKTVEEALERALNEMMLTRDDIEYEVVQQPSKGFLGFGQKQAIVVVQKKVIKELKEIVAELREEAAQQEVPAEEPAAVQQPQETVEEPSELPVEEAIPVEVQPVCDLPQDTEEETSSAQLTADERAVAVAEAQEKGKAFLSKIFQEMKLSVQIDVFERNGYLVFDLKGENLGILIGRRGDTLDALQFLMNLVINEKGGPKIKGLIDIEHYREKREETLIGLAHKLAAKARKTGQKVVLEPMNPQERRIIHMALQGDRRVTTFSEGEEPYRKVVIEPQEGSGRKEYKKPYKKHYSNKKNPKKTQEPSQD